MQTSRLSRLAISTLLSIFLIASASATQPGLRVIRLESPEPAEGRTFGFPCVLTDRFAVVSDASIPSDLGVINQGRVRVFDPATGILLRTLKAKHPETVNYFGRTLAVYGNLALIGCYTEQVFLFDLNTGKQLRTIQNPGADGFSFFGQDMQLTERYAIITNPSIGVYVYEVANENPPLVLSPPDSQNPSWFGASIHCHDQILLVGQLFPADSKGVIHRYDLETGQFLGTSKPIDGVAFDRFGQNMVGAGHQAFASTNTNGGSGNKAYPINTSGQIGQPFSLDPQGLGRRVVPMSMSGNLIAWSLEGEIILTDAVGPSPLQTITGTDLETTSPLSLASIAANRMLVGAPQDDLLGNDAGAAFIVQPLLDRLPAETIMTRGQAAPGANDVYFNDLRTAAINHATGRVVVGSSLRGPGSNGGLDRGVFDDIASQGTLDLAAKSRDDLGSGVRIAGFFGSPMINNNFALFPTRLGGTGVTPTNNRAVFRDNGTNVAQLLRTGQTLLSFGGATLASFGQIAQSSSTVNFASPVRLVRGIDGTTAADDSGLLMARSDNPNSSLGSREGSATNVPDLNFGQFLPRVSYQNVATAFVTMLPGDTTRNQALFTRPFGSNPVLAVRRGDPAPAITDGVFSRFLSENVTPTGSFIFRAKVGGAGIVAGNNEGIWLGTNLIARTGSAAPEMPNGVVWARFQQICPQTNRILIRARVRGPGITAANDEVVYLYQEDGSFLVLYREGAGITGLSGARGGTIRRFEANIDGTYTFIASLRASRPSANLAVFGGDTFLGTPTAASSLRRPELKLRKGTAFANGPASGAILRSFRFGTVQTQDFTGMSCKGLPNVTGAEGTLLRLHFSDQSARVVKIY